MDFVKEGKLEEEQKRKQAEWERVRTKEDPLEAPSEVFDNRTLYEKLKEQHDIKKQEHDDMYSLKNIGTVRGIDDDECVFLNEVALLKSKRERDQRLEEKREMDEVKKAFSATEAADALPKINCTLPASKKTEKKQSELLKSAVVLKRKISATLQGSTSTLINSLDSSFEKVISTKKKNGQEKNDNDDDDDTDDSYSDSEQNKKVKIFLPGQIVVGVLPGLGEYNTDSSSSEESSDDDVEENTTSLSARKHE
jgi:hypothetical protein